jgi:hypothetical protein
MITYVCQAAHRYTIEGFLNALEPQDRARVRLLFYADMFAAERLPISHMVFTDLDRLTARQLAFAGKVARGMASADARVRVLNHPARFRQRFELLDTLWHEGLNPFRAYRLDQRLPDQIRFPVFIRSEAGAEGPLSPLIRSRKALDVVMARFPDEGRPRRGLLAVEFCDVKSADGYFRKYSAFRIGSHVLAHHIQRSDDWVVKRDFGVTNQALRDEELDYIVRNPHEEQLKRIFDVAQTDFGRIDYGVANDQLVTFETNSNPTFPGAVARSGRHQRHQIILPRLIRAFLEIGALETMTGGITLSQLHGQRTDQSTPPRGEGRVRM